MSNQITNQDKYINSRDVIRRIEELESDRDSLQEDYDEALAACKEAEALCSGVEAAHEDRTEAGEALEDWLASAEAEELTNLNNLAEQGESLSDWNYGVQLIHDDAFEEAMDELLEGIDAMPKDLPDYMSIVVDYDMLQSDYTDMEFDGQTFWGR